jgi:predicted 3-demethylubiquinone-9 3-methyltransferase (glyoxalase superfamily)
MERRMKNVKKLTTFLWFEKEAAEAAKFYVSVFRGSKITETRKLENTPSGTVEIISMEIFDRHFQLMSAGPFVKFNEAISFVVECESQKEIDYYWEKLSGDPKAEQCGWLKDKYGVSWQIVPTVLAEMQKDKDGKKVARVTEAFLKMKKFDIAELKRAYERD